MSKHHSQQPMRLFRALFLFILTGILLLSVWQLPLAQAEEPATPQQVVAHAWQLAQDS